MTTTQMNLLTSQRCADGIVKLWLAGVTLAIAPPVCRALLPTMMAAAEIVVGIGQAGLTFLRTGGF